MLQINRTLEQLSDAKVHSIATLAAKGSECAAELSSALQALPIPLVFGRGTVQWVEPLPLLNSQRIITALVPDVVSRLNDVSLYSTVDSTNTRLKEDFVHGQVVSAEYQDAGRGRHGRQWQSPFAQNIYLSLGWRLRLPAVELGGLSLAIGIVLATVLQSRLSAKVGLKWPNDLYLDGRKLGGILVELVKPTETQIDAVIGMGLNISMREGQGIDQPWVAFDEFAHQPVDRNPLIAEVLNALVPMLEQQQFRQAQWLQQQWAGFDLARHHPVKIINGQQTVAGIGAGITDDGNFLLQTSDGLQQFSSGEVSLRLE